ncbi:MAG: hypothetical protein JNK82_16305 [Myxococcaceae bacterium]|nr:hypothetical protein [Myxococcaceae bacterium]
MNRHPSFLSALCVFALAACPEPQTDRPCATNADCLNGQTCNAAKKCVSGGTGGGGAGTAGGGAAGGASAGGGEAGGGAAGGAAGGNAGGTAGGGTQQIGDGGFIATGTIGSLGGSVSGGGIRVVNESLERLERSCMNNICAYGAITP